jgi:hypothetical protein
MKMARYLPDKTVENGKRYYDVTNITLHYRSNNGILFYLDPAPLIMDKRYRLELVVKDANNVKYQSIPGDSWGIGCGRI